jgi:hypothetical protein
LSALLEDHEQAEVVVNCDFIHPNWGSCVASGTNHEMHQFNIFENNRLVDQKFCHNDDWQPPEHKTKEAMATDLLTKTRATREFQRDLGEGLARKTEGTGRVLAHTPQWYRDEFQAEAERLAKVGVPFTSEDITSAIGFPSDARGLDPETEDAAKANNGVGAMMNALARKGIITKAGSHAQAARPNQNAAEVNLWVGTQREERPPTGPGLRNFD